MLISPKRKAKDYIYRKASSVFILNLIYTIIFTFILWFVGDVSVKMSIAIGFVLGIFYESLLSIYGELTNLNDREDEK